MKKIICVLLTFAALFALAACGKKVEVYVEPPTEILSLENGSTAVYEVVTDENGENITDESGLNKVVPYDPPVTEKGGYIVTSPEGNTLKQSQTTDSPTAVAGGNVVDLDDNTAASGQTTKKNETTMKNETTISATTQQKTTAPGATPNEATTAAVLPNPVLPEPETVALGDKLSEDEAAALVSILSIDNTFDEALCVPDYYKAEKEMKVYISSVEQAISKIKANKSLYKYVGDTNLTNLLKYLKSAQEEYGVFMGMVRGTEEIEKKPSSYYTAYENFQNVYRQALKTLFFIKSGAEEIIYN